MATKKYVSLSKLSDFLENLKAVFAYKTHTHSMSDISDYTVDSELSSTSTNPVQNKVIDAEFEAISQALNVYDLALNDKANVSDVEELSALVGDTSVAEQISEAVDAVETEYKDYVNNLYKNCNKFVIDYGLPVKISTADMPVFDKTLTSGTATYGTVEVLDAQTFVYTPTVILTGVETVVLTFEDGTTYEVYIYPADSVYYEENFLTYTSTDETNPWTFEGTAIGGYQKASRLGSGDIYGYDDKYVTDGVGVSNGSYAKNGAAGDTSVFTFTGTGASVLAICGPDMGSLVAVVRNSSNAITDIAQVNLLNDTYVYGNKVVLVTGKAYDTYTVTMTSVTNTYPTTCIDGIIVYGTLANEENIYTKENGFCSSLVALNKKLRDSDQFSSDPTQTSIVRMSQSDFGFTREILAQNGLELQPNSAVAFEINKTGPNPRIYCEFKGTNIATSISYVDGFDVNSKLANYHKIDVSHSLGMFHEVGNVSIDGKSYVILKNTNAINRVAIETAKFFDCELVTQPDQAGVDALAAFAADVLNGVQIPEQVQANWAQNDETAVDYVKNRTHYENRVYTEVGNVDASVVVWRDDAHYEDTKRCMIISSDATTVFNKQFDTFVIGETYRVIINGVEYETTAYSGSVLGNPLFLTGTVDTEEDFCIYKMLPFSVDVFLRGVEDLPESISLSVDSVTEEVVQLDEKYIPDTIARVPTEDDALALVVEMGLVSPTVADDGSIYTDENGVIYTL